MMVPAGGERGANAPGVGTSAERTAPTLAHTPRDGEPTSTRAPGGTASPPACRGSRVHGRPDVVAPCTTKFSFVISLILRPNRLRAVSPPSAPRPDVAPSGVASLRRQPPESAPLFCGGPRPAGSQKPTEQRCRGGCRACRRPARSLEQSSRVARGLTAASVYLS